jgi:hypothetical protein
LNLLPGVDPVQGLRLPLERLAALGSGSHWDEAQALFDVARQRAEKA